MKKHFLFLLFLSSLLASELTIEDDFELLTGKNLQQWSQLSKEEDFQQLRTYKQLYEKNFSLHLHPSSSYKIPKLIHFIWIGPRPFPLESIRNIRTWIQNHPDWKIKFWTDRERPTPCNGMEKILFDESHFFYLKKAYESAKNWSEKADILTYEILLKEGGIYADHDANSLISFDALNRSYDFYSCLELPQKRVGDFTLAVGHGLIGAKPNHPIIQNTVDVINQRWQEVEEKYSEHSEDHKIKKIMNGSYIALTYGIQGHLEKEGNIDIVFPTSFFFAKNGLPFFYSKHFFASSWIEKKGIKNYQNHVRDTLGEKIRQINKLITLSIVTLSICIISFLFLLLSFRRRNV